MLNTNNGFTHIESFVLGSKIGNGSSGMIYAASATDTNNNTFDTVVKIVNIKFLDSIMREYDILKTLNHPNIIKYKYYSINDDFCNIFMDYAKDGDLLSFFNKKIVTSDNYKFCGELFTNILKNIIDGMIYLHANDIIHMDLKPENILIFDNVAIIIDLTTLFINNKNKPEKNKNLTNGTFYYMAPEIVTGKKFNEKCDVWSFGRLVTRLLNIDIQFENNKNFASIVPLSIWIECDCTDIYIKNFIQKCLCLDMDLRPSFSDLLNDNVMKNCNIFGRYIVNNLREQSRKNSNWSLCSNQSC